jgi:uroporphyrinogen decarboxylase
VNSRERVLAALNHEEPDRVPLDLGGSLVTSIALSAYASLRTELGMPVRRIETLVEADGVALVDADVRERLGLDVVPLLAGAPGEPPISWENEKGRYYRDPFGCTLFLPRGGSAYDYVAPGLPGPELRMDDLEGIHWSALTDAGAYSGVRAQGLRLRAETDCAIFGMAPNGHDLLNRWFRVRGMQDGLMGLLLQPEVAEAFFDRLTEEICRSQELFLHEAGDLIDVHFLGDDFGTQAGTITSPDFLRRVILPRWSRIVRVVKEHTRARVFFHSCGAVEPLIPDLIEMGVEVLNPIQLTCAGMEPAALKSKYGKNISFWGGGVDTQSVLALGSVQEVRAEVRRRVSELGPGGGFVFTPVHNIQPGVPAANVIAAFDEARCRGGYPIRAVSARQAEQNGGTR